MDADVLVAKAKVLESARLVFEDIGLDSAHGFMAALVLASDDVTAAGVALARAGAGEFYFTPNRKVALFCLYARATGLPDAPFSSELAVRTPAGPMDGWAVLGEVARTVDGIWERIQARRYVIAAEMDVVRALLAERLPAHLHLEDHQVEAVAFARLSGGHFQIADEMGLGKTVSALAYALLEGLDVFPMVVASPASMVGTWKREIEKWLVPLAPHVERLDGGTASRLEALDAAQRERLVLIGSWAQLNLRQGVVQSLGKAGFFVGDESHFIANTDAQRTRASIRLRSMSRRRCLLTGTPMPNGRHRELFSQLLILGADLSGQRRDYMEQFGAPSFIHRRGKDGKAHAIRIYEGRSHEVELARLLSTVQIQRTKEDVKIGLPEKIRYFLYLDLEDADRENIGIVRLEVKDKIESRVAEIRKQGEAEGKPEAWILRKVEAAEGATAISMLSALRMATGLIKARLVVPLVSDLLQDGRRPILFCAHHNVAGACAEHLHKALPGKSIVGATGSTPQVMRDRLVAGWQEGKGDVLVLTRALGSGITLTSSSAVVFVERYFQPGEEFQAEDRVHRIGQQRKCGIWYPHASGTTDDVVGRIQTWKEEGIATSRGSFETRLLEWIRTGQVATDGGTG